MPTTPVMSCGSCVTVLTSCLARPDLSTTFDRVPVTISSLSLSLSIYLFTYSSSFSFFSLIHEFKRVPLSRRGGGTTKSFESKQKKKKKYNNRTPRWCKMYRERPFSFESREIISISECFVRAINRAPAMQRELFYSDFVWKYCTIISLFIFLLCRRDEINVRNFLLFYSPPSPIIFLEISRCTGGGAVDREKVQIKFVNSSTNTTVLLQYDMIQSFHWLSNITT